LELQKTKVIITALDVDSEEPGLLPGDLDIWFFIFYGAAGFCHFLYCLCGGAY